MERLQGVQGCQIVDIQVQDILAYLRQQRVIQLEECELTGIRTPLLDGGSIRSRG